MILIKLGGSIISDKRRYKKFRSDVVRNLANYIPKKDVILVHGGGSYGHILAHKYKIRDGFEEWKRIGFAKIAKDMMDLNRMILRILLKKDIPAVAVPPHSFHIMGDEFDSEIFKELLSHGMVPLTYGDVILHRRNGIDICSGDYLMMHLAEQFRPSKTIFVTDVDGIYDRDPENPDARLIKILKRDFSPETSVKVKDVTGGMKYKIEIMRNIARYSRVYVINGYHPERLKAVLNDEKFIGTVIK